jgi:hypothetical protein
LRLISRNGKLMSRFAGLGEQIAASLDEVGDAISTVRSSSQPLSCYARVDDWHRRPLPHIGRLFWSAHPGFLL